MADKPAYARHVKAGRTTYVLIDDKYYEPLAARRDPKHRWRAHTDKKTGKMYFSQNGGKTVVWTLPDAAPDPAGDVNDEVSELMGRNTAPASPTEATSSATPADDARRGIEEQLKAKIMERVRSSRTPSPNPEASRAASSAAAAVSVPSVSPSAPSESQSRRSTASAERPSPAPPASNGTAADAAEHRAPSAAAARSDSQRASDSGESPATSPTRGSDGGKATYWRERLQRHRARTLSPASRPSSSIERASVTRSPDNNSLPDASSPAGSFSALPSNQATPQPDDGPKRSASHDSATSAAATSPAAKQPDPNINVEVEKQLYEERRRKMMEADAQLQKERAEALRAERIALDRQRLAAEEAARQQAEYAEILAQRKAMEERRLALERDRIAAIEHAREEARARAKDARRASEAASPHSPRNASGGSPFAGADDGLPSALDQAHASADARIHAAREFTAALSVSMLKALDEPEQDEPDPAELDKKVENYKRDKIRYSATHSYEGQVRGKHKHGRGVYHFNASGDHHYDGEWEADKKHGKGTASLKHTRYEGAWQHDRVHGKGLLQTESILASATFAHGSAHGNAVVQHRDGDSFGGKLRNNKVASPGALTHASGDRVEWRAADPSRPGTGSVLVSFANGDSYAGEVSEWQFNGQGQFTFGATGDSYTGTFRDHEMTGEGVYIFASDGSVYDGAIVRGAFHGRGKFTTAESVYDGEWARGKMHGKGTVTFANGDVWKGVFDHDRRAKGSYVFSKAFALA